MTRIDKLSPIIQLLAVLSLCFTLSVASQAQTPSNGKIKVGVIVSLSGEYAFIGTLIRAGIDQLFTERTSPSNIEFIYEDFGDVDKAKAVTAFKKLVSRDNVQLVVTQSSSEVLALAPIARQAKVPLVVIWDDNEEMKPYRDITFGFGYRTELVADKLIKHANSIGVRDVAFISFNDVWSELFTRQLAKRAKEFGMNIVNDEAVSVEAVDLKAIALKVRKSEAVFLPIFGPPLYSMLRSLHTINYQGKVYVGDGLLEGDAGSLRTIIEGIYFTQVYVDDNAFVERINKNLGTKYTALNAGFAALGYDIAKMLASLEQTHTITTREGMLHALNSYEGSGLTGNVNFKSGKESEKCEPLLTVKSGEVVRVN
jgi:ABC-type branched-subunit amino acid transport system substrate-binding protein